MNRTQDRDVTLEHSPDDSSPPQSTEIVYVCSPAWQHYLFASMRSLLLSGSTFDNIVVFCVGKRPRTWRFHDPRIIVEEVPPLTGDYFFGNYTYLCTRQADRVVYLDTDTMILKPLDGLWENVSADYLARPATGYKDEHWDQETWLQNLARVGAEDTPYFNTGISIFQNASHKKLRDTWLRYTREYLDQERSEEKRYFAEQIALSLALGNARLSYHLLSPQDHSYGWVDEPYEGSVVFHSGGQAFWHYANIIEDQLGIGDVHLPAFRGPGLLNDIILYRKLRRLRFRLVKTLAAHAPWMKQLLRPESK